MSKRRRRAAQLQHEKNYKAKFKKDLIEKSTMVYCAGCSFGFYLHEYSSCPQCGRFYSKSIAASVETNFEKSKSLIPRKERCQWCEIEKFYKVYEMKASNLGKNVRLCKKCAITLGKEKKEEEKDDGRSEERTDSDVSDSINA